MGSRALSALEPRARGARKLFYINAITMFRLISVSCLVAAACSQFVDPQNAKILKEQRFNAGDGRFGAAFAQEDGTVYREETSADGERVGQYSYIDQDGKTITVRYTAGKDGFRILEGDHVPTGANGQTAAQFQATPAPRQQFAQQQQPQQQQFVQPRESTDYDYEYYDGAVPETSPRFNQQSQQAPAQQTFVPAQPVQRVAQPQQPVRRPVAPASNSNPFINPHDPTHRDFNFNRNGGNFGGRSAPHQASAVPPCADCAGVNPFINPFDASHGNPSAFIPAPTAAPRQQQFQQTFQQPQQFAAPATRVTEAPRNFFPPGQLQLNRFENGFNFDFTSQ